MSGIEKILGFQPQKQTKHEQGVHWRDNPSANVFAGWVVLVECISSKSTRILDQLQMFQGFHRLVRKTLRSYASDWLGEMATEARPTSVLLIFHERQQAESFAREFTRGAKEGREGRGDPIEFRGVATGGQLFRFSNVHEQFAFGGPAIIRAEEMIGRTRTGTINFIQRNDRRDRVKSSAQRGGGSRPRNARPMKRRAR